MLATLGFISCSKSDDVAEAEIVPIINLDTSSVSVDDKKTSTVQFNTNVPWKVTVDHSGSTLEWLDVQPRSGRAGDAIISLTAKANPTVSSRSATINIYAGKRTRNINVMQPGAEATIILDKNDVTVEHIVGNFELQLTSNGPWVVNGMSDWIDISEEKGNGDCSLLILYRANKGIQERSCELTFSNASASAVLKVTQRVSKPVFSITPSEAQTIGHEGGSVEVIIVSNRGWTITSDQAWAEVDITSGIGHKVVMVTIAANTSSQSDVANITFTTNDGLEEVLVIHREVFIPTLSITPTVLHVPYDTDETYPIQITSNVGWTAFSDQLWARIDASSGEGDRTVTLSVEPNPTIYPDVAYVTFESVDNELTDVLTIYRGAFVPILTITPSEIDVINSSGTSISIQVTSNTQWTVTPRQDWVSVSSYYGVDNQEIQLTIKANNGKSQRKTTVVFANEWDNVEIEITQNFKQLDDLEEEDL